MQSVDIEKGPAQSTKVDKPAVDFTSSAISEETLTLISKKLLMDGYKQHMFAAGGLSAGIASQLISTTTTTNSLIAGGIAHTLLFVACMTGLSTVTMHASSMHDVRVAPNRNGSTVAVASVLPYLSLWFTTIGIVLLAWAIQPEPVAIIVTAVFALVLLGMVTHATFASFRNRTLSERRSRLLLSPTRP